jgi:hypothetical protein
LDRSFRGPFPPPPGSNHRPAQSEQAAHAASRLCLQAFAEPRCDVCRPSSSTGVGGSTARNRRSCSPTCAETCVDAAVAHTRHRLTYTHTAGG